MLTLETAVMPSEQVIGNTMFNCFSNGVRTMVKPQGEMCGNIINIPEGVDDVSCHAPIGGACINEIHLTYG